MCHRRDRLVRARWGPGLAACLVFLAGCAGTNLGPAAATATATVEGRRDTVWLAVVDVLTAEGYTLRQLDRAGGVVVTAWSGDPSPFGDLELPRGTTAQRQASVVVTQETPQRCMVRVALASRHHRRGDPDLYFPVHAAEYDLFFARLGRRLGIEPVRQSPPE